MAEGKLRDFLSQLESKNVTDRMNTLGRLVDVLNEDRIVNSLNNTEADDQNKISWDTLYIKINSFIVSEIYRCSSKNNVADKNLKLFITSISNVTQVAGFRIKASTIVSSVLSTFEDEYRKKLLGSVYLHILDKYVLDHHLLWGELTEDHWTDLINLTMSEFSDINGGKKSIYIEILFRLVKNSCKCSLAIRNHIRILEFLETIFTSQEFTNNTNLRIQTLKITNILCLNVSTEHRHRVCKFLEDVCDIILLLYDKEKNKTYMHHFLRLCVTIHNPGGIAHNHKAAYAHNLCKWEAQIQRMFALLDVELRTICKEFANKKDLFANKNKIFLDLVVVVRKQVSSYDDVLLVQNLIADASSQGSSAKRPRSLDPLSCTLPDNRYSKYAKLDSQGTSLVQLDTDTWTWLLIVQKTLETFPEVYSTNYCELMEQLELLYMEKRDLSCTKAVSSCFCLLLDNEVNLSNNISEEQKKKLKLTWDKISDVAVRTFHANTISEQHALIRKLIITAKLTNITPMLQSFSTGSLIITGDNISTLTVISQYFSLPDSDKSPERVQLLEWIFRDEQVIHLQLKELSALVFILITKRNRDEIDLSNQNVDKSEEKVDEYLEKMKTMFLECHFNNFINKTDRNNCVKMVNDVKIDKITFKKLLSVVNGSVDKALTDVPRKLPDEVELLLQKVAFMSNLFLRILSYFPVTTDELVSLLKDKVTTWIEQLTMRVSELLKIKSVGLEPMATLYQVVLPDMLHVLRRDATNVDFLRQLFDVFRQRNSFSSSDKENKLMESMESTSSNCKPHSQFTDDQLNALIAARILCRFCWTPQSIVLTQHQRCLMNKLTEDFQDPHDFDPNKEFDCLLALEVLNTLSESSSLTDDAFTNSIQIIFNIMKERYTDFNISIMVLKLIKKLVPFVDYTTDQRIKAEFVKLLEAFLCVITTKKQCGVKTVVHYIECLVEVAQHDLNATWAKNENGDLCFEHLVDFLFHDIFEIRFTAAKHIGVLFIKTNSSVVYQWQGVIIQRIYDKFLNKDKNDFEWLTTVLITFAKICYYGSDWRRTSLSYLLQLVYNKNKNLVLNALSAVADALGYSSCKHLLLANLKFILSKWSFSFDDLPYQLLESISLNQFYNNFQSLIVPIYLQKEIAIESISVKLNISERKLLRSNFPEIMALLPTMGANSSQRIKLYLQSKLSNTSELLQTNMDLIIVNMFRLLNDQQLIQKFKLSRCIKRQPFMPCTLNSIVASFPSLAPDNCHLFSYIGEHKPSVVQKVLLYLFEDLKKAVTEEEKLDCFLKYVSFCDVLFSKLTNDLKNICYFVVKDVFYVLINLIMDTSSVVAIPAAESFIILEFMLFGDIMIQLLPYLASVLVPIAKHNTDLGNVCLKVLKHFVCDHFNLLKPLIDNLDPFPNNERFKDLSKCLRRQNLPLQDEIKKFINVGRNVNSYSRVEGLGHLLACLKQNGESLKLMYEELRLMRGFSEDCASSLLHQLIVMLVDMATHGGQQVKIGAAKCLGELGPADLSTLILKPEETTLNSDGINHNIFLISLNSAVECLHLDDIVLKRSGCNVLYSILNTTNGHNFLSEQNELNLQQISPFLQKQPTQLFTRSVALASLNDICSDHVWFPGCKSHKDWIRNLVVVILENMNDDSNVIESLIDLAKVKVQFCEQILPVFINIFVSPNQQQARVIMYEKINNFFLKHFRLMDKATNVKDDVCLNVASVKSMLYVVDYIRRKRETIDDDNMNYLLAAKAAQYCSAYFTSMLYAELWSDQKRNEAFKLFQQSCQPNDVFEFNIDTIHEKYPEEGKLLSEILRHAYSKIGINEALHGCGSDHLLHYPSRVEYYKQTGSWSTAALVHDALMSSNNQTPVGMAQCLYQLGQHNMLSRLLTDAQNSDMSDLQYNCSWRLGDWSQVIAEPTCTYSSQHYLSLKYFIEEDTHSFTKAIDSTRAVVIKTLTEVSLESSQHLYDSLSKLQCIEELEEFSLGVHKNLNDIQAVYQNWQMRDNIPASQYCYKEPMLAQRGVLIREELARSKDINMKHCLLQMLGEVYLNNIGAARKEKRFEIALINVVKLGQMQVPEEIAGAARLEEARVCWQQGDKHIGKYILSDLLKSQPDGQLKANALKIYGDWMAETRSENAQTIIANYYLKSIAMLEGEHLVDAFASLAKFADGNYKQLKEYLSSPSYDMKKKLSEKQEKMASALKEELDVFKTRDKLVAYNTTCRQSVIDNNEIDNINQEKNQFFSLAVKYYLLSLQQGDQYNMFVFRLVSLWLSSSDLENVKQLIEENLPKIPTYKFLCVLPQLVPRMADISNVSSLLERSVKDHPHHSLPFILAMANSYEDDKYMSTEVPNRNAPRVIGAQQMVSYTLQNYNNLQTLLSKMNTFAKAMIQFANYVEPSSNSKKIEGARFTPQRLQIRKLGDMRDILFPTLTIPYNKDCKYDNIIGVHSIDEKFEYVGGMNMPKKLYMTATDGIKRPILVKGRDDLRQDSVMQQVFTIMNSLLAQSKGKLVIRTYKVIPLSQRSGIIEWCVNTQPLGVYLVPAHEKYHPDDLPASECRQRIVFLGKRSHPPSNNEKKAVYLDICAHFQPALHYFFLEKFPTPGVWFERRLAYTKSVATSSMVGYILGIGDRHVQNILLDNNTAEVIHIDLGIAFEQGHTLTTPETVPFRLSRDIEDGMGISGVEGIFRSSCEKTMEVLRENQDTIVTLLEVLLYDPLYAWTLTPEKAYSIQNSGSTSSSTEASSDSHASSSAVNKLAERALLRLKQKLNGFEEGISTSVERQVNYLIHQARDPANLCRLFHGWQAYL